MPSLFRRLLSRVSAIPVRLPNVLSDVIYDKNSPHYGHTKWQLMLPSYHIGRLTNYRSSKGAAAGDPQNWYSDPNNFPSRLMSDLAARSRRKTSVTATYEEIFSSILKRSPEDPVLSIGCGEAQILSYLVRGGTVPAQQAFGCDLLEEKVIAARRSIVMAQADASLMGRSQSNDVEVMKSVQDTVFTFDILDENSTFPKALMDSENLTVIFSSVLTVFTEDQLRDVVRKTCQLKPKYIIANHPPAISHYNVTSLTGIEPLFGEFGYREIFFKWATKTMRVGDILSMWLPRTWWGENAVSVLERNG